MVGLKGFRLSFEFPFYPDVSLAWIQIKFNAHDMLKQPVITAIQSHLKNFATLGPTEEEIKKALASIKREQSFLRNDNYFLLSLLSDYLYSDWSLEKIPSRLEYVDTPLQKKYKHF